MRQIQHVFDWARESVDAASHDADAQSRTEVPLDNDGLASPVAAERDADIGPSLTCADEAASPDGTLPPIARTIAEAVAHGVFGWATDGPIVPDDEAVLSLTTEHSHQLKALLIDLAVVVDAARNGCDPRSGKPPRTAEAAERLEERCCAEGERLKQAYAEALAAYAEGFGQDASDLLDQWVRKRVAGPSMRTSAYDPSHPWHYLAAGDGAVPISVTEIPPDDQAGKFLEADLPKNPKKRLVHIRELFDQERERLAIDRLRYLDVIELGIDALSRYDREIAYSNPEIAVASTLALKYRHISLGLGRIAWLEKQVAVAAKNNRIGDEK